MADEDLKRHISNEFNRVSERVVSVRGLMATFNELAPRRLGFFERGVIANVIKEQLADPATQRSSGYFLGIDANGAPEAYVSSRFLQERLTALADTKDAKENKDVFVRATITAAEAVARSEDQTPRVRTGQIKPSAP